MTKGTKSTTTISVVNQKGGVTKTSGAIHLGAMLAARGHRVLLLDVDQQRGLTSYFEIDIRGRCTIDHVLTQGQPITDSIMEVRPGLDVVPASPALEQAELYLNTNAGGELRLRVAMDELEGYDYCLIDCPSGYNVITRNALLASQAMLVPINCEPAAYTNAVATVDKVPELQRYHRHEVALLGVLLTCWRGTRVAQAVERRTVKKWGNAVFKTRIRRAESVNALAAVRATVTDSTPAAIGPVYEDFENFTGEVITRCRQLPKAKK